MFDLDRTNQILSEILKILILIFISILFLKFLNRLLLSLLNKFVLLILNFRHIIIRSFKVKLRLLLLVEFSLLWNLNFVKMTIHYKFFKFINLIRFFNKWRIPMTAITKLEITKK
jgi:hypothetical protein